MHVNVFLCPEHGEIELYDFTDGIALCDICGKQMTKIAEYDQAEDGSIKNMMDGKGRKLTKIVKVFQCSEHKDAELINFQPDKAFCPCCGKEMKKTGEYME
jgi:uncharacterized Zn finger protein (UPF0148 family)